MSTSSVLSTFGGEFPQPLVLGNKGDSQDISVKKGGKSMARILIVEDELAFRRVITLKLVRRGPGDLSVTGQRLAGLPERQADRVEPDRPGLDRGAVLPGTTLGDQQSRRHTGTALDYTVERAVDEREDG